MENYNSVEAPQVGGKEYEKYIKGNVSEIKRPLENLYKYINGNGEAVDNGSYNNFLNELKNPDKQNVVYNTLKERGVDIKKRNGEVISNQEDHSEYINQLINEYELGKKLQDTKQWADSVYNTNKTINEAVAPTLLSQIGSMITDKDYRDRRSAKEKARDILNKIEDIEGGKQRNFVENFRKGFDSTIEDVDTWSIGLTDLANNTALYSAVKKYDEGKELNDNEKSILESYALENELNSTYGGDTWGRNAGSGFAHSISFRTPMATGKAIAGGAKLMKKIGKEAVLKSVKGKVVESILDSGVMALSTGAGLSAANATKRASGEVYFDEKDLIDVKDRDGIAEAIAKGLGSTAIEFGSEMSGQFFKPGVNTVSKWIGNSGVGKLIKNSSTGRWIEQSTKNIANSKIYKAIDDFEKNVQFYGTAEEFLEEQVGTVLNATLIGDSDISDIVDRDAQLQTLVQVGIMGGAFSAAKATGYRSPKSLAKKEMTVIRKGFEESFGDNSTYRDVLNEIDNAGDYAEAIDIASKAIFRDQTDKKHIEGIRKYLSLNAHVKGYEEGINSNENSSERRFSRSIFESFDSGYAAPNPNDIYNDYINSSKEFDAEQLEILESVESPVEYMKSNGNIHNKEMLFDYFNKAAALRGVESKYLDEASVKTEVYVRNMKDNYTMVSPKTGEKSDVVHTVAIKENGKDIMAAIISGKIINKGGVGNEIDYDKSDQRVTIRPYNGPARMVNTKDVFSSVAIEDLNEMAEICFQKFRAESVEKYDREVRGIDPQSPQLPQSPNQNIEMPQKNISVEDNSSGANNNRGYERGDNVIVDGVEGVIGQITPEGNYIVSFEDKINYNGHQMMVAEFTPNELRARDQSYIEQTNSDKKIIETKNEFAEDKSREVKHSDAQAEPAVQNNEQQSAETLQFPVDKAGSIDYDAINDAKMFYEALKEDFSEDGVLVEESAINVTNGYLKEAQKEIKSSERMKNIAEAEKKRMRLRKRIKMLEEVLSNNFISNKIITKDKMQVAPESKQGQGIESEKQLRIEKLRNSTPVEITGEEYVGKYELNRDSAKEYIKNNLRDAYMNADSGEKILVSRVGANEVTSHGERDKAHLQSIVAIPQIIENAIFIIEELNTKNNGKYQSYRYYITGLKINDVDYTVKMVVGRRGNSYYYDHELTQIEKGTLIDATRLPNSLDNKENSLSDVKDRRLISILQDNSFEKEAPTVNREISQDIVDKWNSADKEIGAKDKMQVAPQSEQGQDIESEKQARIEKLRNSTPVEITGEEIAYSGDLKDYRRNALEYGKSLKGVYTNRDTGTKILVSNTGLEKLLSHDKQRIPHIQSIAAIPQLIKNSIFVAELQPGKKSNKFDSYKYFISGLKINGEDYTVKIVVGEKNGDRYYDHSLTEIEKGELLSKIDALSIAFNANHSPEISEIGDLSPLSDVKDRRLISILQNNSSEKEAPTVNREISQDIVDKWNSADKEIGAKDIITLPNGKTLNGRWVMTEAFSITPSHDPVYLKPTEGFPTAENGGTINDNDYSTKRAEIESKAQQFDARAIDNPIVVQDGIVLSGNNRTMSSILAAERGTDNAYNEALPIKASQRGFVQEQIEKFEHPRLVFELSEKMPLTTETFAMFNQRETKSKSPVERAIVAGKIIDEGSFNRIAVILDGYDKLSDLYSSLNDQREILHIMLSNGLINQNDVAEIFTESGFTQSGKSLVESLVIGGIVEERQLRLLDTTGMRKHRAKIVKNAANILLSAKIDKNVLVDINEAIDYLAEAYEYHNGLLYDLVSQLEVFDQRDDFNINGITMAILLNKKEGEFKKFCITLSETLRDSGEDLFGNIINKNKIYEEYRRGYFDQTELGIVDAAQRRGSYALSEIADTSERGSADASTREERGISEDDIREVQREDAGRARNRVYQRVSQGVDGEVDDISRRVGEASNIVRRCKETAADVESAEGYKRRQTEALVEYAKERGIWEDDISIFGELINKGGENEVYYDGKQKSVFKLNNFEYTGDDLSNFFDRIEAHNELFPNAKYTFIGMTENSNDEICAIIEQPYINVEREATEDEISHHMKSLGFKEVYNDEYYNDKYSVFDAVPNNVLIGIDGNLYFIDTQISLIREDAGLVDSDVRFRDDNSSKEVDKIIAEAKANGTYLKAPNGNDSNLSAEQWALVRTDAFKKWFGDWEKQARIEKLRNSTPVEITGEEHVGKYELTLHSSQKYILDNFRGEYFNSDTGDKITISRVGAKKVTSHDTDNINHLQSIIAIPSIIENAIFITEDNNIKNNGKYDSYKYYVTGLNIGGVDYTARLTVGVKNGVMYYDHGLTEIEKGTLLDSLERTQKPVAEKKSLEHEKQVPLSQVKDRRLISILQNNSSKVVDANFEPMVVYHGTNKEFYQFDTSKVAPTAVGSFFTTDKEIASEYAGNISNRFRTPYLIEAFLNLRNPFDYDNNQDHKYILRNYLNERDNKDLSDRQKLIKERVFLEENFDSEIRRNRKNNSTTFVVFNPVQIKSATANNGEFSASNSDIRYKENALAEDREINQRFNSELQQQIDGTLDKKHIYQLGNPNEILLSCGIPDLPIELKSSRLLKKSEQDNHIFKLNDIYNLPNTINNPLMIFNSKTIPNSRVILTELSDGYKNYIVAIHATNDNVSSRKNLQINEIKSIYPKDFQQLLKWITNDNLLQYADKNRATMWLGKQQSNSADVAIPNNSSTNDTAKIEKEIESAIGKVENFNNPTLLQGEKLSVIEDISLKLGVKVDIVTDKTNIEGDRKRSSKGWFDIKTGKVTILVENHATAEDCVQTYLHEVVAHKGLRELLGEEFDNFLDSVYENADNSVKKRIDAFNGDKRVATEEYIASLAEKGFKERANRHIWESVKRLFRDLISRGKLAIGFNITDNDIRYMLWRSYNNLQSRKGLLDNLDKTAKDAVLRNECNIDNSTLRYRGSEQLIQDGIHQKYEEITKTIAYKLREGYQDSMLSLLKIQEIIEKEIGRKLYDYENAYIDENQLSSKNLAEKERFDITLKKELIDAMAMIEKRGVKGEQISNYIYAKHGVERNEFMASREANRAYDSALNEIIKNKTLSEEQKEAEIKKLESVESLYDRFIKKDYSGLEALTQSGIDFMVKSKEIISEFEGKFKDHTDILWQKINAISNFSLKKSYESGLISKDRYEEVRGMYRFYVPFRGWEEDTAADVYEYLKTDAIRLNAPLRAAKGRSSLADDPIATLINIAYSSIVLGNKNMVKVSFFNMVKNNPSTLFSISKKWYVIHRESKEITVAMPDIERANVEDIPNILKDFEIKMQELALEGLAFTKHQGAKMAIKATSKELNEHIVAVNYYGTEYHIYINGNPILAQALNGLTNPEITNEGTLAWLEKSIRWVNRQMSANFTSRNPTFVFKNATRDLLFTNAHLYVKEGGKYHKRYMKNYNKNLVNIPIMLIEYLNGKLDTTKPEGKLFEEFILNGGETGYTALMNVEEIGKILKKDIKRLKTKQDLLNIFLRGAKTPVDVIKFLNRSAEDLARFSAYQTSRELGRGVKQSVFDAKEASVNFNKKGRGSYGAQLFSLLYLFWNPAVQSLALMQKMWGADKARAIQAISATVAIGIGSSYFNELLFSLFGDDEDRERYYNLPDFVRRSNLCIWIGGDKFLTIPIPIDMRGLYGMGEIYTSWSSGRMDLNDAIKQSVLMVTELFPVDPTGGGRAESVMDVITSLVPSAVRPIVELSTNKSFFGYPIYKDYDYNKAFPQYTKAYANTNDKLVDIAKVVNDATGGDMVKKGAIDINPAAVEHFFNSYIGGVSTFVNQSWKTIMNKEQDIRNYPVASAFLRESFPGINYKKINEKYYDYKDIAKETKRLVKNYEKESMKGSLEYYDKLSIVIGSVDYQIADIFDSYAKRINKFEEYLRDMAERGEDVEELNKEYLLFKAEVVEEIEMFLNS